MVHVPFRIAINTDECARARVLAGYSLRSAAQALGITPTHLGYVESGKRGASPSLLKRMAELYAVPMTSLFTEVTTEDVA